VAAGARHVGRSVTVDHFATGYRGLRVGRSGRPFWIEDVTMWDLMDADGGVHGQALRVPA